MQFVIQGKKELKGTITVSGAKNAALKILPASILSATPSRISNVPDIADIRHLIKILESIGAKITFKDNVVEIDPSDVKSLEPDPNLIKKLRGSIVLFGPLLAKFGKTKFTQPGGCLIGSRPIDDHLDVFRQMGVSIHENGDDYDLTGFPKTARITLKKLSVTATENAIMASVFAKGKTEIHVAAAEPEIIDLAKYLNNMGAKISGAGTHVITIEGISKLHGTKHEIIPDRIEAGTYIMAGLAANAEITIGPFVSGHLSIVLKKLEDAGAQFNITVKDGKEYIHLKKHKGLVAQDIDTRTYPGFPTDLQSPYATLMTQAKGKSTIFETIFEGRFLFLDEFKMMGAETEVLSPHVISVSGPIALKGTKIVCRDIRGGAALVAAGLIAEGVTVIEGIEYIDRGYEKMDEKFRKIGADIKRIQN